MKKEEKNSKLAEIATLKKDLMMLRIKASSGDAVPVKEFKIKKKEIARLFTQINDKNAAKKVEKPAAKEKTKKTKKA